MYGFLEGDGDSYISRQPERVPIPAHALPEIVKRETFGPGMVGMALLCGPDPLDHANMTNMYKKGRDFSCGAGHTTAPSIPDSCCAPF